MKTLFALFLLAILPNLSLAQTDSLRLLCPCSVKHINKARRNAHPMAHLGQLVQVKCRGRSYFFLTKSLMSETGELLNADREISSRAKVISGGNEYFMLRLSYDADLKYTFKTRTWSLLANTLSTGQSLGNGIDNDP